MFLPHRDAGPPPCCRGSASLEFALITPVIILILLATCDLGNFVLQQMKLVEAARAGGQYAQSFPSYTQGIADAVTANLPTAWGSATTGACAAGAVCLSITPVASTSGSVTQRVVTIVVSRSYTPVSPLFLDSLTSTSATYVTRLQ